MPLPEVQPRFSSRPFLGSGRVPRSMPAQEIPRDYGQVTIEQAKSLFPDMTEANWNRPYIEGDHFQAGIAWVGPGPRPGEPKYSEFLELLEPAFVSKNVLHEGCNRLTESVIGWEPRWAWVPRRHDLEENPQTDAEIAAVQELEEWLTDWWDKRQVHKSIKRMIFYMLWAQQSGWRLYTPSGLTSVGGSVKSNTLEEALDKIFLDIPDPQDITVWEHPDTKQKLGICLFSKADGTEQAELCYLENDKKTTIRILPDENNKATNDFGGHLTIYAVTLDKPLIREQERSLQRAYNMTLTLLEKGLVDNHFLTRLFTNALPPGKYTYEEDGKTKKGFVPAAGVKGGNVDVYLQGLEWDEPDLVAGGTKKTLKDPGVHIVNPLDPNGTIRGAEYWYQALLEAMRQDHILINQLATPSGKSREHSRGDFIDSTKDPVMQADLAGRELIFTVVCMAEAFMGSPGKWTKKFKPVFKCRPNYGPLSVAERQQNVLEAEKGFLSDQTVMALNGTDDVDAELALIRETPRAKLALANLQADTIIKWGTDFPREVALYMAGLPQKVVKKIQDLVTSSKSLDPGEIPKITDAQGNTIPPGKTSAGKTVPPAGNRPSTKAR